MPSTAYMSQFNGVMVNTDPNDSLPVRVTVSAVMVDDTGAEVQGPGGDWFNGPLAGWSSTIDPNDVDTADLDALTTAIRIKMEGEIRLNFQDDAIVFVWLGA